MVFNGDEREGKCWEGPGLRIKATRDKRGRLARFVSAVDVERLRLERLWPTILELESFSELASATKR